MEFVPVIDPDCWRHLLSRAEFGHSVQAFGYGEAKASNGWQVTRGIFAIGGRPVAIVQALEKRFLGLRVTRINRGPMFLDPRPSDDTVVNVYKAVRRRWGRLPFGLLLIAPALLDRPANRTLMQQAGFRPRKGNGWGSARINLDRNIDEVFDSLEHNWRKSIRSAARAGVTVSVVDSEADHAWMIERHLMNMAEKGFLGHDEAFLRSLRQHSGADYILFQAIHEGEPVAGLVILKLGTLADSVVAWFGAEGRKCKAGNAITWAAIQEMQRRGCLSYDVGGINSDKGFSAFKSGMNGVEYFLVGEYISF